MIGRDEVRAAAARIGSRVRRTPVLDVDVDGYPITLKLELFQRGGSFKVRGAFNRLLSGTIPPAGVVTASGGNHGLAVALAGGDLGVPVEVFVPASTPEVKRRRIADTGAVLRVGGDTYDEARTACGVRAGETGAVDVHAYDDPAVVTGQGTVFAELDDQTGGIDTVLVAVGGGGLIGGAGAWFGEDVRLVSVEPESAPTLAAAVAAGRPVDVEVGGVAADSLGARRVGDIAFGLVGGRAEPILVSDDDILTARRWLWEHVRVLAEPGGATALAALLTCRYVPEPGERVAVVVCGGNTDSLPL